MSTFWTAGSIERLTRPVLQHVRRIVPGQLLKLDVRSAGRAAVLEIGGEIDMLTGPMLEAEARRLLASEATLVVLHMREVTFMGVSGLAVLIRAAEAADRLGKRLRLQDPSRTVLRVLPLVGLAGVADGTDLCAA